jgi:hypothetical protein
MIIVFIKPSVSVSDSEINISQRYNNIDSQRSMSPKICAGALYLSWLILAGHFHKRFSKDHYRDFLLKSKYWKLQLTFNIMTFCTVILFFCDHSQQRPPILCGHISDAVNEGLPL